MTSTQSSITDTNPCIVLHGPHHSSISDTLLSAPSLSSYPPDYVLLQIAFIGVCGSDVHFYTRGGVGSDSTKYVQNQPASFPGLIMGHEATATVLNIGLAVQSLVPGDKVAIKPGVPCRKCPRCIEGMYNLCPGMRFAASFHSDINAKGETTTGNTPGALCKYYMLLELLCYRLPENIDLDEGVLVEPLAVAVHAIRTLNINPVVMGVQERKSLVVFGAGTVGLLSAAVGCAFGISKIVLVDIDTRKLKFAKSWLEKPTSAATHSGTEVYMFQSKNGGSPADTARSICKDASLGEGAHYVIEASGAPSATITGIAVLRPGGDMVQTGLVKRHAMDAFPIVDLSEKEIHLHGAFRYKSGDFATAVDLLRRGVIGKVGELISRIFAFEEYEDARWATRDGNREGTKNIIRGV